MILISHACRGFFVSFRLEYAEIKSQLQSFELFLLRYFSLTFIPLNRN
jgi:hypothetical protein